MGQPFLHLICIRHKSAAQHITGSRNCGQGGHEQSGGQRLARGNGDMMVPGTGQKRFGGFHHMVSRTYFFSFSK